MGVEIKHVEPIETPILDVILTPAAWPERQVRAVHRLNFGTVDDTIAFGIKVWNERTRAYHYGAFACCTKQEAQEFIDAVQQMINEPCDKLGRGVLTDG